MKKQNTKRVSHFFAPNDDELVLTPEQQQAFLSDFRMQNGFKENFINAFITPIEGVPRVGLKETDEEPMYKWVCKICGGQIE
jgi:hypothetical protein